MSVARATGHSETSCLRKRRSRETRISRISLRASGGMTAPNWERIKQGVGVISWGSEVVVWMIWWRVEHEEAGGRVISLPTWTSMRSLRD